MTITIVGLGPGNGRLLTREAWDILTGAEVVYLRTKQHPSVADLPQPVQLISFDHLYETADSFDQVYGQIVAEVMRLAQEKDIIYAVPGDPFMGESTVTALMDAAKEAGVETAVVSGLSFVTPTLAALQLDGLDGLQLFDAIEIADFYYPPLNPDVPLLLAQVYNRLLAGELKLRLTAVYPDEHPVFLVHAASTDRQMVESVPLYAIDRSGHIDHLTSLYVPPLPYKASLAALAETVAVLRSPEGCPWDQEQTSQSLRPGFLEEASEVLAAIDAEDPVNLCEELGDVFYHLVMQTQLAAEEEAFKLTDVLAGIEAKLKRRHPHIWGDWEVADSAEVVRNWEALKKAEKETVAASVLDDIPLTLPTLMQAQKIQQRVGGVGFDWPDVDGVFAKLTEEIVELKQAASPDAVALELGDVLFVVVNLAIWLGVDAETALRQANARFSRRFRQVEQLAASQQLILAEMDIESLENLWQEAKRMLAKTEAPAKVDRIIQSNEFEEEV